MFLIMCTFLTLSPADERVYQYLDKKRSVGKPYYVNMIAVANKSLRISYARVKEVLSTVKESLNSPT